MSATSYMRGTGEIVEEIVTRMRALMLPAVDGQDPAPAFGRVELFDSENLVEAFRFLLLTEQRVCLVIPLMEGFEPEFQQLKLVVKRTRPVAVLVSDQVMGDRQSALWGNLDTPGAYGLLEAALPELTGLLLGAPNKVSAVPRHATAMTVKDTENDLPGRLAVVLEVECRGGRMEARLGDGAVW